MKTSLRGCNLEPGTPVAAVCVTVDLSFMVTKEQTRGRLSKWAPGKSKTLQKAGTSLKSFCSLLVRSSVYVTINEYMLHHRVNNVPLNTLGHIYPHLVYAWWSPNGSRHTHAKKYKGGNGIDREIHPKKTLPLPHRHVKEYKQNTSTPAACQSIYIPVNFSISYYIICSLSGPLERPFSYSV